MFNKENSKRESGIGQVAEVQPTIDGNRRRFTTAGLAASGVVMTLASRPVLGATTTAAALSPSGWSSANASRNGPNGIPVPLGYSPGYWKNHTDSWPAGTATTQKYRAVFKVCTAPFSSAHYTLLDALVPQIVNDEFGRLIVCAYLNAVSGRTAPYLVAGQVVQMASGSFTPSTGGAPWDKAKITAYLKQTIEP